MTVYEFTCKAAFFAGGGIRAQKGDKLLVSENDTTRLRFLRKRRGAFTEKALPEVPEGAPVLEPETAPKPSGDKSNGSGQKSGEGEEPALEKMVTPAQLKALTEAGYPSLLEIADAKLEDLVQIKGIGEPTATKLLAAVGKNPDGSEKEAGE